METLVIKVPEKKSAFVKGLLTALGVTFGQTVPKTGDMPNAITQKTIKDARKGVGLGEPIDDSHAFISSLYFLSPYLKPSR